MWYNRYKLKFERNAYAMIIKDLQVIDYRTEFEEGVEFGTCELCFYTDDLVRGFLTVSFLDATDDREYTAEVEDGEWDYGEYNAYAYSYNIIDFGAYLTHCIENKKIVLRSGQSRHYSDDDSSDADFIFYDIDDCIRHFLIEYDSIH